MNRLWDTRCYLCGAMDRARDAGVGWRRDIRATLDLGIRWLDPTRKPIDIGVEDDASRAARRAAKERGDYDFVTTEMRPIRRVDLRMVDVCDFVVVNLDMEVHACGTYEEISLANRQKKPVFIHCEQGKKHIPDWMFAVLPHEFYFHSTWKELHTHVKTVAHDENFVDQYGRWYFFDWMGIDDEAMRIKKLNRAIVLAAKEFMHCEDQRNHHCTEAAVKACDRARDRLDWLCRAEKHGWKIEQSVFE